MCPGDPADDDEEDDEEEAEEEAREPGGLAVLGLPGSRVSEGGT